MLQVHILSNEEFDSLPKSITRGSRIDDSLGFADPRTGQAYVRYTASHDLNKFLVNHELEELMQEESGHEDENGIRHKKVFKEILAPLFTGVNLQTKKFSPFGILDPSTSSKAQRQKEAAARSKQVDPNFKFAGGQQGGPLGAFSAPQATQGAAGSGIGGETAGRLGAGLGNQSLAAGARPIPPEFKERVKGFFAGRAAF